MTAVAPDSIIAGAAIMPQVSFAFSDADLINLAQTATMEPEKRQDTSRLM
jgi:hypothetical protein